jgi:hypothetical protein
VNRVQLFHHFKDVVTIPTQPENTIPAEKPDELEVEEDEDDYEGNVMNEEQVEEVNEEQINDVLPDGLVPIVPPLRLFRHNRANWGTERPILDRLADEIFGPSQRTRSRGPVTAVPLPDRPVEYKKNQKKK